MNVNGRKYDVTRLEMCMYSFCEIYRSHQDLYQLLNWLKNCVFFLLARAKCFDGGSGSGGDDALLLLPGGKISENCDLFTSYII